MRSGYFEGADLRPLVGTDVRLPERGAAIVFIFAPEGPALDSLSKFDAWAASAPTAPPTTNTTLLPPAGTIEPATNVGSESLLILTNPAAGQTTATVGADLATTQTEASDTISTPIVRGAPYANERYKFRIVFPEGWDYEEAGSGAGAKAIAPSPDMTTDMRAYAVRRATSRETPAGAAEGYFENFRERMGNRGLTDIEVTGRYELADREFVGREFEYKFTQPGPGEFSMDETRTGLGRIQIFASGGVFKVALVEGPAYEFKANEAAANAFMETFHPY